MILLHVRDDVDLVEDDARVEDVKGGVVEDAREDDVFEELEAIRVVDLALDGWVADGDGLVEFSAFLQEFAVVGFVGWKFGIICGVGG